MRFLPFWIKPATIKETAAAVRKNEAYTVKKSHAPPTFIGWCNSSFSKFHYRQNFTI